MIHRDCFLAFDAVSSLIVSPISKTGDGRRYLVAKPRSRCGIPEFLRSRRGWRMLRESHS